MVGHTCRQASSCRLPRSAYTHTETKNCLEVCEEWGHNGPYEDDVLLYVVESLYRKQRVRVLSLDETHAVNSSRRTWWHWRW